MTGGFSFMENQIDLSHILNPEPHPLKQQLRDMGIPIAAAARYADRSYQRILDQLNGRDRVTERTEAKLKELIQLVKAA
jgi:beta-phosphoglucomutase-like phosphatase (HAD superfamily)